ncbi:type IX secretion system sortase PorU [Oscillatoria amoena NRMC-F 0135]|nr:type IX secretion system sortase PorU [Oscillatoria amoena NRMC-F 0135]
MKKIVSITLGLCVSLALMLLSTITNAQPSVLATGTWYKVAVEKNGIYKIDQAQFRKMGFTSNADPRKIKLYTHSAGMLPQRNSAPRVDDLVECAIFVEGEQDGVFNQNDFVLFYAEGPDKVNFDPVSETFQYERHRYARENYYFITVGETAGKRVDTSPDLGASFPVIQEFDNYAYHEINQHNILKSGREWYGERFELTTEQTIRFALPNITENSPIKVVSNVMSQSFGNTSFNVRVNGVQVGQHTLDAIPNTQYGIKGREASATFLANSSTVLAANRNEQEIQYQYVKGAANSVGYLNSCLFQFRQRLQLYGNQTIFRSALSTQHTESTFRVNQATAQTQIWDITNPTEARIQETTLTANAIVFGASTSSLKAFIVFNSSIPSPRLVGRVGNQNLHGLQTPVLLIITHPDFKNEALRLKAHRESVSGIDVVVATTEEVYHEFSGGKQDVSALRDFTKFLYDKNEGKLKSLLLLGKCSYDYLDVLTDNKNFVPTYQSRNSLHPLLTYSSDDFFAFMEDHEGEWGEGPVENHTLDIAVGRLPVKSAQEAAQVVDKIIHYDTDAKRFGQWRKNMVFVADDGDFNIHQSQADQMARNIDENFGHFNTKKNLSRCISANSGGRRNHISRSKKAN